MNQKSSNADTSQVLEWGVHSIKRSFSYSLSVAVTNGQKQQVIWVVNYCSSSMEQSSSDHSSPSPHVSQHDVSIPGEPSVRLATIHEAEELEAWVHTETFEFTHHQSTTYSSVEFNLFDTGCDSWNIDNSDATVTANYTLTSKVT